MATGLLGAVKLPQPAVGSDVLGICIHIREGGARPGKRKSFLAFHCAGMHVCASTYQCQLHCMDACGHGGMYMCPGIEKC